MVNQPYGKVLLHSVANVAITVAGNNATSNIATTTEVVQSATIRRVWWSGAANWFVKRGSNTVLILAPGTEQFLDLMGEGASMSLDAAATINCTCTDTANSFIMLELGKTSSNSSAIYD